MWYKISFGLVLFCFLMSCQSKKAVASENVAGSNAKMDTVVFYQTHVCNGRCPVYELLVLEDGSSTLNGKHFYKWEGLRTGKLPTNVLAQIHTLLKDLDLKSLKEIYDDPKVQDVGSSQLVLKHAGIRKSIYNRYGAPAKLKDFQVELMRVIEEKVQYK